MQHPLRTIGLTQKASRQDIQCLLMAKLGLSAKVISEKTGLTKGQITYRCQTAGLKIADYRNGTSEISKQVIEVTQGMALNFYDDLRIKIQNLTKALEDKR